MLSRKSFFTTLLGFGEAVAENRGGFFMIYSWRYPAVEMEVYPLANVNAEKEWT